MAGVPAAAVAQLRVQRAAASGAVVATLDAQTALDLPGNASVPVRLEVQCSGDGVHYVLIDFATPRLSNKTETIDVELQQRFDGSEGSSSEPWSVEYDVLAGREEPPTGPSELRNLQVNRMVHIGDQDAFVARLVRADYFTSERPASPGHAFLFELSHLDQEIAALRRHCGL